MHVIPPQPNNIALNKPVVVSSIEGPGLEGEKAVDGQRSTRWSSQFSDPQFIYVDLESVTHIEQIDIIWETAYASEYKMQISDNAIDWTTIEHITNGDGGLDRILTSSEGRYVRMYGIQRGTEWGYSIFEFEIYESRITNVSDDYNKNGNFNGFEYYIENNYPNPFNPSTTIKYQIPGLSFVILKVFDVLGNEIETLVNEEKQIGTYELIWNATDQPSGVYFYQLRAGDFIQTKKMILIK